MEICNRIMDWNCYGKHHLGQEDCENNLKIGKPVGAGWLKR